MAVLTDIRSIFSRRKPIDHADATDRTPHTRGTQAERLKNFIANGWKTVTLQRDRQESFDVACDDETASTTPPVGTRFRDANRPRPIAALEAKPMKYRNKSSRHEAGEQVLTVAREMRDQFVQHSGKTDRLIESVGQLTEHTGHISSLAAGHNQLVDLLTDHLDRSRDQDQLLAKRLNSLHETTAEQTDVLGQLRAQLETSSHNAITVAQSIDTLNDSLALLNQHSEQSSQIMVRLAQSAEQRDHAMTQMMSKTQKWMLGSMIACGGVALTAIIIASIALLS